MNSTNSDLTESTENHPAAKQEPDVRHTSSVPPGFANSLRRVVAPVLGAIAILLLLELICFSTLFLLNRLRIDARIESDAYSPADTWVRDYFREMHKIAIRWEPYLYWRRQPHSGQYINIDALGRRFCPAAAQGPGEIRPYKPQDQAPDGRAQVASQTQSIDAIEIIFFGGSTMWGEGVRDHFTLPNLTGLLLEKEKLSINTVNYGEIGYVSTQNLIGLQLLLRQGYRPDYAVFYDGVNDAFSAYQQGRPGIPQNEFNRAREFNVLQPGFQYQGRLPMFHVLLARSSLLRALFSLRVHRPAAETMIVHETDGLKATLPEQVVEHYLNNLRMINALAVEYRFKPVFYWQPTIFQKNSLSSYENEIIQRNRDLHTFIDETYEIMSRTSVNGAFHNISRILAEYEEPLFIDFCHINEKGNQIIARRLARDLLDLIAE